MSSSLLEEPAVLQRVHLLTVSQYHAMAAAGIITERVELLEGLIVEVHGNLAGAEYTSRQVFSGDQVAVSEALPSFQVELSRLFPK